MPSKTTLSVVKFVGSPILTSEWFSSRFIDFLTVFVSTDVDLGRLPLRIELSHWIKQVEALTDPAGLSTWPWNGFRGFYKLIEFISRLQDPNFAGPLLRQVEHLCPQFQEKIQAGVEKMDFAEVNRLCNEVLRKTGWKGTFDVLTLIALTRAAQTIYRCIARYGDSPTTLIQDALAGDRTAVLKLIKIDKFFVVDSCTQAVIRNALQSSDTMFNDKLARAQLFRPRFERRQACEIYLIVLAGLRVRLPPLAELRRILDPEGTVFPGLYDFEKCFERRKKLVSQKVMTG